MSISRFSGQKLSFTTLLLTGLLSLTACGGSRDEPFDPGDDDEEEDVEIVPVTLNTLYNGLNPTLAEDGNKRLQVMTDEDEYHRLLDQYTDDFVEDPDFNEGQVVLYDAGFIDTNPCAHKLNFRSASAQEEDDTVVKVTLEYEDYEPETGSDCTDTVTASRPFRFMYVRSRAKVIFAERIYRPSSSQSSTSASSASSFSSSSSSSSFGF
jgi:hypothetical protein